MFIQEKTITVPFGKIPIGTTFKWADKVYIKTNHLIENGITHINAINLANGESDF